MSSNSSKAKRDKKYRSDNDDKNKHKSTRSGKNTLFSEFESIINKGKEKEKPKTKKDKKRNAVDSSDDDNRHSDSDESSEVQHRKNKKPKLKNHKPSNSSKSDEEESGKSTKTSGSDNDTKDNEDSGNENDNSEIVDNVENSDSDSSLGIKKKKKGKKKYFHKSIFTPFLKNQLQFYIRNVLFQKVKIVDESHLEAGGNIIQEVLEKLKIDKSSKNINAYINEIRQIIKRVISSRRGYIKKQIGKKFEGELINLKMLLFSCIEYKHTHASTKDLIKSKKLSFEMLESLNCCFKDGFEQDPNVRQIWYIFCYHFLPLINRNWKKCLVGSRLLKPTFLYEHITTSDQAMVFWLLKSWEPKMKVQCAKNWPSVPKQSVEGEQELKAGLKEYITYYNVISEFEAMEDGELAGRWSDIFWETMILQHPKTYKKGIQEADQHLEDQESEDQNKLVALPGLDTIKFPGRLGQRKSFKLSDATVIDNQSQQIDSNSNNVAVSGDYSENGSDVLQANSNQTEIDTANLTNQLFLDEIKNPTGV